MPTAKLTETGCCPRFDPAPWADKEIVWQDKLFVKDRVRSFLHVPLNFGKVVVRNIAKIEAAGAGDRALIVCDENSLWGADMYIGVTKEVPGAQTARISGTFLAKVFEGPFKNVGKWVKEMRDWVASQGKRVDKLYFYYTTCPKCAKVYGKNYVVILARVG